MGIFDKAKNFLSSEKGERYSDKGLDAAADAADRLTGGKHADKIQNARDSVDERVGNAGADDQSSSGGSRQTGEQGQAENHTGGEQGQTENHTGPGTSGTPDTGSSSGERQA